MQDVHLHFYKISLSINKKLHKQMGKVISICKYKTIKPRVQFQKKYDFPQDVEKIIYEYTINFYSISRLVLELVGPATVRRVKLWTFSNCPCLIESAFPGIFYFSRLLSDSSNRNRNETHQYYDHHKSDFQQIWHFDEEYSSGLPLEERLRVSRNNYHYHEGKNYTSYYDCENEWIDVDDSVLALLIVVYMSANINYNPLEREQWKYSSNGVTPVTEHYWGTSIFSLPRINFDHVETIFRIFSSNLFQNLFQNPINQSDLDEDNKKFRHPVFPEIWIDKKPFNSTAIPISQVLQTILNHKINFSATLSLQTIYKLISL